MMLDYSDGTHGYGDFDDWDNLDFTFFKNTHFEWPKETAQSSFHFVRRIPAIKNTVAKTRTKVEKTSVLSISA